MYAAFSDIRGGWSGDGNIDKYPFFKDPVNNDFHLTWPGYPIPGATKSPCIDAGYPVSPQDPDGTITDMGAWYFNQTLYRSFISDIPDTTFAEDHSLSFDLDNYIQTTEITDSTLTWHVILLNGGQVPFNKKSKKNDPEDNITIGIDSVTHIVTFSAGENYFVENVTCLFTATDNVSIADSDLMRLTITPVNDPPVIKNFPAAVEFYADSSIMLRLNECVSDVDSPNSTLTWAVFGNDSVNVTIEKNTNIAVMSVSQSWFCWESLIFRVMDDSSAFDEQTLNVHVLEYTIVGAANKRIPGAHSLSQNYPNPFNPEATILYGLPQSGFVVIKLYDTLGKEVITLVDEFKKAGFHSVKINANKLNSGLYFYKIFAGEYSAVKKCIILK